MRFSYPDGSRPLRGYTIKRGIGTGGFGEVYLAIKDSGKEVALKKIQRNLDVELRGVKQCINLKHVNLITLWDICTSESGENWVEMEYVPGPSLQDVIEAHPNGLPTQEVRDWFAPIAAGVAHLHDNGIVHRDLKPANIFFDQNSKVVKIGDYGLSKYISCSHKSNQTEAVGTFHYMAPEIGRGMYGKQIDIYALAIVLFEMLTGDVPFNGESSQEIMMKHLTADPDVSSIPLEFQKAISKAMRKDAGRRYQDIPSLLADLPWPDLLTKEQFVKTVDVVGRIGSVPSFTNNVNQPTNYQQRPNHTPESPQSRMPVIFETGVATVTVPGETAGQNQGNAHGKSHGNAEPTVVAPATTTQVDGSAGNQAEIPEEPLAQIIHSGLSQLESWWSHANFSATVKMTLVLIGGAVVIMQSGWLLPLLMGLMGAYLVYYLIRVWYLKQESIETGMTMREAKRLQREEVRQWIRRRPKLDRFTELIGSLLVAAFVAIVLNLLVIALGEGVLGSSVSAWTIYVWLTFNSIVVSWALLGCCKPWEVGSGEDLLRRIATIGIGICAGGIAFCSAISLNLDIQRIAANDFDLLGTQHWTGGGVRSLTTFLLFHAALFGILRWWRQLDPLRRTRLSTLSVFCCLLCATLICHLLSAPLTLCCILAVVVSVSVQLASPWHHPRSHQLIGEEASSL